MNELVVIDKDDHGGVIVQDEFGGTAYLTKEEYDKYCRSIEI